MGKKKDGDKVDKKKSKESALPQHLRVLRRLLPDLEKITEHDAGIPKSILADMDVGMEEAELREKAERIKIAMGPRIVDELLAVCKKQKPPMDMEYLDGVLIELLHEQGIEGWPKTRQAQETLITNIMGKIGTPKETHNIPSRASRQHQLRLTWGDSKDPKDTPGGGSRAR